MNFLCPNHRRYFADLPVNERKALWLFWMESAHACSEQDQWQDVISLAGSAFDLACLNRVRDESCMRIELTLSAILVSRALSDRGDHAGMKRIVFRALECLQNKGYQVSSDGRCELAECVAVLRNSARQAEFFADNLNWPRPPFGLGNRVTTLRTLH